MLFICHNCGVFVNKEKGKQRHSDNDCIFTVRID